MVVLVPDSGAGFDPHSSPQPPPLSQSWESGGGVGARRLRVVRRRAARAEHASQWWNGYVGGEICLRRASHLDVLQKRHRSLILHSRTRAEKPPFFSQFWEKKGGWGIDEGRNLGHIHTSEHHPEREQQCRSGTAAYVELPLNSYEPLETCVRVRRQPNESCGMRFAVESSMGSSSGGNIRWGATFSTSSVSNSGWWSNSTARITLEGISFVATRGEQRIWSSLAIELFAIPMLSSSPIWTRCSTISGSNWFEKPDPLDDPSRSLFLRPGLGEGRGLGGWMRVEISPTVELQSRSRRPFWGQQGLVCQESEHHQCVF